MARERKQPNLNEMRAFLLLLRPDLPLLLDAPLLHVERHELPWRPQVHHLPVRMERHEQEGDGLASSARLAGDEVIDPQLVLQCPLRCGRVLELPELEARAVAGRVPEAATAVPGARPAADRGRERGHHARHGPEVDADDVARVGQHVDRAVEVVHGGRHGVGVEPEVELVVAPRAALGVEHLDGRAAGEPPGEAHHPVVRGRGGVERQHGQQRLPARRRQPRPPPRRRVHDVERRRRVRCVVQQHAVAPVDDGGRLVPGEESHVGLRHAAAVVTTPRRARVRVRLPPPPFAAAAAAAPAFLVQHTGGDERQPPAEVVAGDEAPPRRGHALEPRQRLVRQPHQNLREHVLPNLAVHLLDSSFPPTDRPPCTSPHLTTPSYRFQNNSSNNIQELMATQATHIY